MAKFKKGESGNPSGRPKQDSARIREELNKHSDDIVKILLDKVSGVFQGSCPINVF